MSAVAWAGDYNISIHDAQFARQGQSYVLNADIGYHLTPAVTEALANGVPITLAVQTRIIHSRRLLWDETVLQYRQNYRLLYHSLAGVYLIETDNGDRRNFPTLDAAVEALGTLRGLAILPVDRLMLGVTYKARLKAWLDVEALPLPLRALAYLHPQWKLESPWYRWSFAE